VGVYHTHNAESYAGDGGEDRVAGGRNGEVVEVGELLVESLNQRGVQAIHSSEVNDTIYIESYDHSYQTAKKMLEENPTIRILLDVHRDGLPPQVGKSTEKVNHQETAKVMIVIGQKNPNWEKNNAIANEIIQIAEQKYPGLFFTKIRYASEARYNQHLTSGALLLEIGSQLNTKEEALAAAIPLAEVLKAYLEK
jgi:stage II sporulation protein P